MEHDKAITESSRAVTSASMLLAVKAATTLSMVSSVAQLLELLRHQ